MWRTVQCTMSMPSFGAPHVYVEGAVAWVWDWELQEALAGRGFQGGDFALETWLCAQTPGSAVQGEGATVVIRSRAGGEVHMLRIGHLRTPAANTRILWCIETGYIPTRTLSEVRPAG